MTRPSRDVWLVQSLAASALQRFVTHMGVDHVLPVKGVVTGRMFYADIAERPLADVDLRVPLGQLARVPGVVAEAGGHVWHAVPNYATYVADMGGIDLDIEANVGPRSLCGLTVETMIARSRLDAELFGFPCRIPELHDHALLLAINVFKDKLVLANAWSVRDAELVAEQPGFVPARLADLARETGVRALTWIVADWLVRTKGSRAWRAVRDAIGPRAPRPVYARLYGALRDAAPTSTLMRLVARLASDRAGMRADAVLHAVTYESWRLGRARGDGNGGAAVGHPALDNRRASK